MTIRSFFVRYKLPISFFGVVLIILGWVVDKSEPGSWADQLFFRSHAHAVRGLAEMRTGKALTPGAEGFDEIAAVVRPYIKGPHDFMIAKIEVLEVTSGLTFGEHRAEAGAVWRIRVTVGSTFVDGGITNLDDMLQREYRGQAKDRWSAAIFWLGVMIQFVLAFV
jgi:hypothetical protein